MKNTLVILNADDIAAATQIASRLDEPCVVIFDPVLIDKVAAARLGPIEYLAWDEAPGYPQLNAEAHRLSAGIGRELDALVEPVWPGLMLGSWQHLGLYYLHLALLWYGPLFEAMAPRLAGRSLFVPMTDRPQSHYHASFVPALLLLLQAQHHGLPFQAFGHDAQPDAPQWVPQLAGIRAADAGPFVLTHLPTCFYDLPYLNAELAASGKAVVDLQARQWSVPVQAQTTVATAPVEALLSQLDAALVDRIETLAQGLAAPIDRHLGRWITATAYRERQVAHIVATYRAQLVSLALLERHFGAARPTRLLLSDHDAEFHGPLAAWARREQIPLVVLPHSKTSTDLEFVARDATVLTHPAQGTTVHDVQGRRPAQFTLDLPAQLRFDTSAGGPVRRVGLLLNGIALNGVPGADWARYAPALRHIARWCAELGLELVVRSRPGQTLYRHLLEHAGFSLEQMLAGSTGTMTEFAQGCDLCLMFDAPTSGAIECLNRGVAVLNPVASALTARERSSMHTEIVPRGDIDTVLELACALVADVDEFQQFRRRQFAAWAARWRDARSLRSVI